jgi:hypothetical protein
VRRCPRGDSSLGENSMLNRVFGLIVVKIRHFRQAGNKLLDHDPDTCTELFLAEAV